MVPRFTGFGDAEICTPFTDRVTLAVAVEKVPLMVIVPV
jgi:hypothetical protein